MGSDASAVPCGAPGLCGCQPCHSPCAGETAIAGVGVMCLAALAGVRFAADQLVMNSNDTLAPASHRFDIGAPHIEYSGRCRRFISRTLFIVMKLH